MSIKFTFSDAEIADLMSRQDLSDVIAEIDTLCFQLDFYEMGQWWDYRRRRRKLTHPAVQSWMAHYGFTAFADLPSGAIRAMYVSLKRYLTETETGLTLETLPLNPAPKPQNESTETVVNHTESSSSARQTHQLSVG